MAHEYRTTRRVEFADTDMAGIAHFANFFRWMEQAEHEFVRSLGHRVHGGEGFVGFVRAHASCDYRRPARYEDVLDVVVRVARKTSKGLHYEFEFRESGSSDSPGASNGPSGELLASGRLEVVCVDRDPETQRLRAIDIPPDLAACFDVAP